MPHPTAIGNASEDYFFGLLYAKKNKRKLVVIVPHKILAVTGLKMFNYSIYHYSTNLVHLKYESKGAKLLSLLVSIYFFILRITSKLLYKALRIKLNDVYFHPSLGQDIIWQPRHARYFDWAYVNQIDYDTVYLDEEFRLQLSPKMQKNCEKLFQEFSLPDGSWYVCLHVREGGYSGDFENSKNAEIDNYIEAIKYITSKGGWVFRMGDSSMKNLPPMENVIDYANSIKRSALLDFYLIANCKYYVGTSSGILDTAVLFGKPILLTNAVHWISGLPKKTNDLIIFKHLYSSESGKELSIKEWLLAYDKLEPSSWSSSEWYFIENSSQEIAEAVRELLEPVTNLQDSQIQTDFKTLHLEVCRALSQRLKWNENESINISDWYRFAGGMVSWKGKVGTAFLEKQWYSQ